MFQLTQLFVTTCYVGYPLPRGVGGGLHNKDGAGICCQVCTELEECVWYGRRWVEGGRKTGDYRKDNILIDRLCRGQAWWLWLRQRIPQAIKLEMMRSQYREYRLSCLIRRLSMITCFNNLQFMK